MARKIVALFVHFVKFGRPPIACPYCEGTDIDAQNGFAECRDCGRTWSY